VVRTSASSAETHAECRARRNSCASVRSSRIGSQSLTQSSPYTSVIAAEASSSDAEMEDAFP